MIIYPYQRIPCHIPQTVPKNWAIGQSDSEWMVSATFYQYIANVMYPWLVEHQVNFPLTVFLDGQKKIHLYCLPLNATHILQPCDVSIFKPLKSY